MKKLAVFLLFLAAPLLQAASLVGLQGVEILAVDGKKIKQQLFSSEDFDIDEGKHQVVVMYKKVFKSEGEITSKPHIFEIDVIGKTEISVKHYGNPFQAEKAINKGLEWIIKNDQLTSTIKDSDTIFREGLFPNSDLEGLIIEYNEKNDINISKDIAASKASMAVTATTIEAPVDSVSNTVVVLPANNISKTDLLIETYKNASKAEQKAFRMWMLDQDMNK